ncbi:2-dehydro-3-deoxygluconokinase [Burkholderiales bacterium]|nr:2-dehydro-3-deoxygluconokinase [Burkholderiales bacterium]
MQRYDLVAIGEPLIEFNQARGEDPRAWRQGCGGDTSNVAIAAARLGARVAYVTRLGDDAFGRQFRALWSAEGIALDGVETDAEAPTGVYFVTHGPSGHAFAYLRAGSAASRLAPSNLPLGVIRAARALHVSGISQAISTSACDAVFAAIATARECGARVFYDPNLRPKLWPRERARAIALATIALSDWCLPSLEDAEWAFGAGEPDAVIDACRRAGARGVVYKRGADGCVIDDGRTRVAIAAHRVTSVDATGAGDCFDGAFAARLAAGDEAVTAARYANAAAAIATTGYGAVDPLPRPRDVESQLMQAA